MTPTDDGPAGTIARTRLPVRASVSAGGVDTAYLRVGAGRPILLVTLVTLDAALAAGLEALAGSLAPYGRVIVPLAPAPPDAPGRAAWLGDFLDGVGVTALRLVVVGGSEELATGVARSVGVADPDLLWLAIDALPDAAAVLRFITAG